MKLFDVSYFAEALPDLLSHVHVTFTIALIGYAASLILGLFTAFAKIYRIPVMKTLAAAYISIIRGTPMLVQMFVICFGIPKCIYYFKLKYGIFLSFNPGIKAPFYYAIIALAINYGAFMAESIRAALETVGVGQIEASLSVGMTYRQTMTRIVLPQAFVIMIPVLGNGFINTIMDTSVLFAIGVVDIMGEAVIVGARKMAYVEVYVAAALIYLVICIVIERIFKLIEKKMHRYNKSIV